MVNLNFFVKLKGKNLMILKKKFLPIICNKTKNSISLIGFYENNFLLIDNFKFLS